MTVLVYLSILSVFYGNNGFISAILSVGSNFMHIYMYVLLLSHISSTLVSIFRPGLNLTWPILYYQCLITFATMNKQVIKLTITIIVLISKLMFASLFLSMGMSGLSSSVLPIRWSTVLDQINQSLLNIF